MRERLLKIFDWIGQFLPDWLPFDLFAHFLICFALSVLGKDGVISAASLSLGKEFGDMMNKDNEWSRRDIKADALGIVCGYGTNRLIKYLLTL